MTTEGLQLQLGTLFIHPSKGALYSRWKNIILPLPYSIDLYSSSMMFVIIPAPWRSSLLLTQSVPRVSQDSSDCFTPAHRLMPIVYQYWQHFVCNSVYPRQLVHCGRTLCKSCPKVQNLCTSLRILADSARLESILNIVSALSFCCDPHMCRESLQLVLL